MTYSLLCVLVNWLCHPYIDYENSMYDRSVYSDVIHYHKAPDLKVLENNLLYTIAHILA